MASKIFLRSLRNVSALKRVPKPQLFNTKLSSGLMLNQHKTIQLSAFNPYKDLTKFLSEEIKLEKEVHNKNAPSMPTLEGFEVKSDGPNVTLTKTHGDELITVKFNVNSSVGDDAAEDNPEQPESKYDETPQLLKSRPNFNVEIKRKNDILSFWCSFLGNQYGTADSADQLEDFQIDELTVHNGVWDENVYSVDGSVIDGNLYDLLLNLLEERGMGEDFANNLIVFSTAYEHKLYIELLEKLNNFAK